MMDKFVEANSSNYERLSIKDRIKAFQQLGKNAGHIITRRQAKELLNEHMSAKTWINSTYQVMVWSGKSVDKFLRIPSFHGTFDYLSIKRRDLAVCRNWSDFQTIKNILCKDGDKRYAIEIYPPESRLMNTANQYHIWVFPKDFDLGIGFTQREVVDRTQEQSFEMNGQTFTTRQDYEEGGTNDNN